MIIICGSFFIMQEARKSLGFNDETDVFELNEIIKNWYIYKS